MTRAIFLEFSFYNPHVNLFSTGTLIVEFLSTGTAVHYQSIHVCQLYSYLGSYGIAVLVLEIIFVVFLVYFIVTEAFKIKEERMRYFTKFWNINEMVIIVFSLVSIVMFGMRTVFTNMAVKAVHESEMGEFVNFNTIGLWDEYYTIISSVVVFCTTLKFLKLLRFNKQIGMLAMTLRYATKDLVGFSFTFFIIFFTFTQFSYLIFSTKVAGYKTPASSLVSLFKFALGQFNLRELQNADYVLGSTFFVLFVFIVVMGLMSMLITILNEAFEKVIQLRKYDYDLKCIYLNYICFMHHFCCCGCCCWWWCAGQEGAGEQEERTRAVRLSHQQDEKVHERQRKQQSSCLQEKKHKSSTSDQRSRQKIKAIDIYL